MRKRKQVKGIFGIEGMWAPDLRVTNTIRPVLELLRLNMDIEYILRECATREELEFYLLKWVQKSYEAFPILYLVAHGEASGVRLGADSYSVDDVANLLEGRCGNRVIMFSSCSTLGMDKRRLRRFVEKTGALAVCGYRVDVSWMRSTAFELLLLSHMQKHEFSGRGIEAIDRAAEKLAGSFRELEFRMVTVKDLGTGSKRTAPRRKPKPKPKK